jgi:hypothetical protein
VVPRPRATSAVEVLALGTVPSCDPPTLCPEVALPRKFPSQAAEVLTAPQMPRARWQTRRRNAGASALQSCIEGQQQSLRVVGVLRIPHGPSPSCPCQAACQPAKPPGGTINRWTATALGCQAACQPAEPPGARCRAVTSPETSRAARRQPPLSSPHTQPSRCHRCHCPRRRCPCHHLRRC